MQPPKLSIVGVYREGDRLVLLDANREQYDVTTPQQLWDDLHAILADPGLPSADVKLNPKTNEAEAIGEACDRLGSVLGEQYGSFVGKLAAEGGRRLGPVILNGLRKASGRKGRFG